MSNSKKNLAISLFNLSNMYAGQGHFDKALAYCKDETKLYEALFHDNPQNIDFKNGLATSYYVLGICYRGLNDITNAKRNFEQAELLWSELTRDVPQYVQFLQFLNQVRTDLENIGK